MFSRRSFDNPYTNRAALLRLEDFFGREQLLADIYTRILGGQSVALIGERRIGKSSLLNAVGFCREEYDIPPNYHFVSINLQSITDCTEEFFIEYLVSLVFQETKQSVDQADRKALWGLAQQLADRNERLVVLLDELDVLTQNEQISPEFFAFLRSWSSQFRIPLVAAFRDGSVERIVENEKTGSPFLNIFGAVYVGPMERPDAEDLIRVPAQAQAVIFTDEEVQEAIRLAGYFPLFLQIACYHMFEMHISGTIRSDWQDILEDRFASEVAPHFEYMWNRLSEQEKAMLRALAAGSSPSEFPRDALRTLFRKGILAGDREKPQIFSREFAFFVDHAAPVHTAPRKETWDGIAGTIRNAFSGRTAC